MNRRTFIISSATLTTAAVAGWCLVPANKDRLSIRSLIEQLNLLQSSNIIFDGDWNSFQTFSHLAQSVEYSIHGYPEHKSELFKSTLGKSAFNVFASKGYMKHNLMESIPGAPELVENGSAIESIQRLINALTEFHNYRGELAEHFAYGSLTKEEYEIAHVLHVNDHFSLMQTS